MKINKLTNILKWLFITCILLNILLFVSCSKKNSIIKKGKLTPKEESLVRSVSDKYFIFDIEFGEEKYEWVEVWVDEYEKGVKKEKIFWFGDNVKTENKKDNRIIMSIDDVVDGNDKKEMWSFAFLNSNGMTKTKSTILGKEGQITSVWGSIESMEIKEGDTLSLATFVYLKSDSFRPLSEEFFKEPEKYKNELSEYDYVYTVRCKFSKEIKYFAPQIRIAEVKSIEIKFDDTLKETYRKENNLKEIESFINAYNSSTPFLEEEKERGHINVVIKLENGGEIYLNGGNNKYIKVNKDGRESKITGEDILKIFENFSGQFNND